MQSSAIAWEAAGPQASSDYEDFAEVYDFVFSDTAADGDYWKSVIAGPGPYCEMGCGTGRIMRVLAPETAVVGIDPSAKMLARCDPDHETRLGGLTAIPADDGEFAGVLCPRGAFSHLLSLTDQRRAVHELARVTNGGALLVIDVPFYKNSYRVKNAKSRRHRILRKNVGDARVEIFGATRIDDLYGYVELEEQIDVTPKSGARRSATTVLRTKICTPAELVSLVEAEGSLAPSVHRREPCSPDAAIRS